MVRSGVDVLNSLFTNALNVGLVPGRFDRGRIGILFAVLAAEEVAWEQVLTNYAQEGLLQTAVINENIINLSAPLHYQTPALPSNVIVKFYWADITANNGDTIIPAGQIVQTTDNPPIQYQTIERIILYSEIEYVLVSARSLNTGLATMVPSDYITVISPALTGIKVINPQESWGGADIEDPITVRNKAISARYSYEKGTSTSFDLELSKMGVQPYQYNLVDCQYGYGTFGLYVDTEVDEFIDEITERITQIKGAGIYGVIEKVVVVPFQFNFNIGVVSQSDITPDERNNLIADLTADVINYVTNNGVGEPIIISLLIHYLLDQLLDTYNLFDLSINNSTLANVQDGNGNILLLANQKLEITDITVTITTED